MEKKKKVHKTKLKNVRVKGTGTRPVKIADDPCQLLKNYHLWDQFLCSSLIIVLVYVSFFSPFFSFTVFILLWCWKQPQLQCKNYCSYFHTEVHALRGNLLYAYTLHVQIHTYTCKYMHAPTHANYILFVNVSLCQITTKGIKFCLTKRKNYELEDSFNYKLLITCKNFFNAVQLCKSPPNVPYSYANITNLFFHLFKCYICCIYPEHPRQSFNLQRVTSMTPARSAAM